MTEDFERRNIGNFEFNLVKQNQKAPSILRDAQDNIWVYVNEAYSDSDIEVFVQRSSVQIAKLMEPKIRLGFEDKDIVNREEFWFLGNSYQLLIADEVEDSFDFDGRYFYVARSSVHIGKELFKRFYHREATGLINKKKAFFEQLIGKQPKEIVFCDLREKWGVCTPTGLIKINWRSVMLPERLFHYVLAHEYAHLVHLNHSASFWYCLETLVENCKQFDRELDGYRI